MSSAAASYPYRCIGPASTCSTNAISSRVSASSHALIGSVVTGVLTRGWKAASLGMSEFSWKRSIASTLPLERPRKAAIRSSE